jgi:hypothetical protein
MQKQSLLTVKAVVHIVTIWFYGAESSFYANVDVIIRGYKIITSL